MAHHTKERKIFMIAVFLADGFEEMEAIVPVDILRRGGYAVNTVSIGDKTVTGAHGIKVEADMTADELDVEAVRLAVFPGGMPGTLNLDNSIVTDAVITSVTARGGRLAAICAAPSILGKRGLLEGKKAVCFPGFEKELKGATVVDTTVVTDGKITTARDAMAAYDFANELVRVLELEKNELSDAPAVEEEPKKVEMPDYSGYVLPNTELLAEAEDGKISESEICENGRIILDTLSAFGISAAIRSTVTGPRLTRYEIVPDEGVKIKSIIDLIDDVMLALSVEGIRIEAPIPGKSAIGIEVPNKTARLVRLREIIESESFIRSESKITAAIGSDISGAPVVANIAMLPHAIIAGSVGMGKSVCINGILTSIMYKARPDEVKFILIDPKKVEFSFYNDIPYLLMPVITDVRGAVGALGWCLSEIDRRYDLLERARARNIDKYNEAVEADGTIGEKLPKILIVIDELNDLMLQAKDPIEGYVMMISQKARAVGIHLIVSTQRPSVNVLTGLIKANIPSRISFRVSSYCDSRTVLERAGAEKLLSRGDMLYSAAGLIAPARVQCAYISEDEIEKVADYSINTAGKAVYDENILKEVERIAAATVKKAQHCEEQVSGTALYDKEFAEVVELTLQLGKISTSLIQRKLGFGYSKAAKFIDLMESLSIVSGPDGQKPREALITKEDWEKRISKI